MQRLINIFQLTVAPCAFVFTFASLYLDIPFRNFTFFGALTNEFQVSNISLLKSVRLSMYLMEECFHEILYTEFCTNIC
jgi:hypothetical protein